MGDPYANDKQARNTDKPAIPSVAGLLPLALPSSLQGTTLAHIPVEDPVGPECFKCGRVGHFLSHYDYKSLCVLCMEDGHASAYYPSCGKILMLQTRGHIPGEGFFCLPFVEKGQQEALVLGT